MTYFKPSVEAAPLCKGYVPLCVYAGQPSFGTTTTTVRDTGFPDLLRSCFSNAVGSTHFLWGGYVFRVISMLVGTSF